jgi:hypothetical protein
LTAFFSKAAIAFVGGTAGADGGGSVVACADIAGAALPAAFADGDSDMTGTVAGSAGGACAAGTDWLPG